MPPRAWEEFSDLEQTPAGVRLMETIAGRIRISTTSPVAVCPGSTGCCRSRSGSGCSRRRRAASWDGAAHSGDGPAPGGHGPAPRRPSARGRERPARRRARDPCHHDASTSNGASPPRASRLLARGSRSRGVEDRACTGYDGRERLHMRAAHGRLGLGRGAPGRVACPRVPQICVGRVPRGPLDPPLAPRRGRDADIAEAGRIRVESGVTAPQFEAYGLWATAWTAFAGGRPDEARRLGEHAVELAGSFAPLVGPLLARSALWASDDPGAAWPWPRSTPRATSARPSSPTAWSPGRGSTPGGTRAGRAGRVPRGPACVPQARARLRRGGGGRGHGRPAASPERDAPEVVTAIAAARDTLERLGARPFLARLDAARTTQPAG